MTTPPVQRPPWARLLDRLALLAARTGGRLLGRPAEPTLSALARQDRPGMQVTLPPSTVDALEAGRAAFAEGRYSDALYHFGEVIEADPKSAWGWHGRGDALQLMGAHEAARDAYLRAAELSPGEALHREGAERARAALREKG